MGISLVNLMELIKPLKNNNGDIIIHNGSIYPAVFDNIVYKYTENRKLQNIDINNKNYLYLRINPELIELYKQVVSEKRDVNIDIIKDNNGTIFIEDILQYNVNSNDMDILKNFSFMYNHYTIYNTMTPTIHIDNLKEYNNFNELLTISSSEGMRFFWIDKYPITYFNGLLPINKPDKVQVDIYDNDQASFIVKYTIIKPKTKFTCLMKNRKLI